MPDKSSSNLDPHSDGVVSSGLPDSRDDFQKRLVSGLVMIGVTLGVLWFGSWPFAILVGALAIFMSWEWGRLVRGVEHDGIFLVHATAVAFACLVVAAGQPLVALLALLIAGVTAGVMAFSKHPLLSCCGVFYAGLPAVALIWLRSDEPYGFLAVLFLCLVVWVSDTAAYFGGRAIGGPKLWRRVSPNKTWAGLITALIASGLAGVAFSSLTGVGLAVTMAFVGVILGAFAQAGDLAESALKRAFNVKDVSGLIPGHGGVMDRLDSLVAVAICAGVLGVIVNISAPARALFFGG